MSILNFSYLSLNGLADFVELCHHQSDQGRGIGRQIFREHMSQPGLDPETHCWILKDVRHLKGYCLVHRESPISWAVLQIDVDPDCAGFPEELEWSIGESILAAFGTAW